MTQTFQGLRESTIRSGLGHLQFADPRFFTEHEDTPLQFALTKAETIVAKISQDKAVAVVMPRLEFVGLATERAKSVPFLGVGIDPEAEMRGSDIPTTIDRGNWMMNNSRQAVLGTGLAAALKADIDTVITLLATTPEGVLNAVDVTVSGIADIRIKELSDRYLAIPITVAQELLDAPSTVTKISVVLNAGEDEAQAGMRISSALGGGIAARTWLELAQFYNQVKMLYIGIFGFMGSVLIVVVFLAAVNATLMSVAERTREIGTVRALGARSQVVVNNFLLEGALLGVAASIVGALLTVTISLALNASAIELPPPPGATRGFPINIRFYPSAYLAAAAAMTLTAALASYFPARRAARQPIIDSLAHV